MIESKQIRTSDKNNFFSTIWNWIRGIPPIYPIFIVIFLSVGYFNPRFLTMKGILIFLGRSSPIVILAIGQMFVIATGGLDLSLGSLVTFVVIGSALLIDNDPGKAIPAILILLGIGFVIGLVNGITVSCLKIPSLIATLGMLLILKGGGLFWTGGAPRGYLTDNFRNFGRGFIENVPIFERFPVAVIILLVVGCIAYYLFHLTNLGQQILSIGDNPLASKLSGIKVKKVRTITFILSSIFGVIAGIQVAGFGGVSIISGTGLEMQAASAAVLGGASLLGGKGSVPEVIFGALTLEALFSLLNMLGLPKPMRDAVQGLIIISAVAYAALRTRKKN